MAQSSMRLRDYLVLAFRNIRRQKLRNFLAVLAVVIGSASVTIMLAFVFGARTFYYDQFQESGTFEQVIVNSESGLDFEAAQRAVVCSNCIRLTDELQQTIGSFPHVVGVSPTVDVNVFESVSLDGQRQLLRSVRSYQPDGVIQHRLIAGGDFSSQDGNGKVIIGQSYADNWGYKGKYEDLIGQEVTLTSNNLYTGEGAELQDPQAQFEKCKTGGCESKDFTAQLKTTNLNGTVVGVQSDETNTVFVPLKWAAVLLQNRHYEITEPDQAEYTKAYIAWGAGNYKGPEPLPRFTLVSDNQIDQNGYSSFVVRVDDSANAESVADNIQELGVGAVSGISYANDQLNIFSIISYILGAIGSIALIVAAIGIINTMVMAILERTREIGVMRAVGAKRSIISRLFTFEASLLGFWGGALGVSLGYVLIQVANIFINLQLTENAVPDSNIISLSVWLVLGVVATTTVLGMLAGLYPAYRAAKLDPVEALRHN